MVILRVRQGRGAGSIHRPSVSTAGWWCNFAAPRSPPMPGCCPTVSWMTSWALTDTELYSIRLGGREIGYFFDPHSGRWCGIFAARSC